MRPDLMNLSVLAYLGDSVFEVMVRSYLIKESGLAKTHELQKETVKYVTSIAQSNFMHAMLKEGFFSEDEIAIYKRGRNTKGSKNEKIEHLHLTGFEAIIGTLYLLEDFKRIDEIFSRYKSYIKGK
mgnify:FL=1